MTRRGFICDTAVLFTASRAGLSFEESRTSILARIKAPEFPKRDFDITKYGAVADGRTKCTEAVQKAISECNAAGGGRVVIPAGRLEGRATQHGC